MSVNSPIHNCSKIVFNETQFIESISRKIHGSKVVGRSNRHTQNKCKFSIEALIGSIYLFLAFVPTKSSVESFE